MPTLPWAAEAASTPYSFDRQKKGLHGDMNEAGWERNQLPDSVRLHTCTVCSFFGRHISRPWHQQPLRI